MNESPTRIPVSQVALLALFCACLSSAVGCGYPAFTPAVKERFGLRTSDIHRLQFFTSDQILLRRELPAQRRASEGAELVIADNLVTEEIDIPKKTPGVAIRVEGEEGEYICVSFSKEHPDRTLWFAVQKDSEIVVPIEDKRYKIVHLENDCREPGPFSPRYSKGFLIAYAGNRYQLGDSKMWGVHLLYEEGSFTRKKVRETPPGYRVNEGIPDPPPDPPLTKPPPGAPQPEQPAPQLAMLARKRAHRSGIFRLDIAYRDWDPMQLKEGFFATTF